LKIRFLADANLNQKIVSGLLLRESRIDFELPQNVIPDKMKTLRFWNSVRRATGSSSPTMSERCRIIFWISWQTNDLPV
jgi:hypothetical protein